MPANRGHERGLFACLLALLLCGAAAADSGVQGEWERILQLGSGDFISHVITAIGCDALGRVWVGSDRGLVWTSDSGQTWNVVTLTDAMPLYVPSGERGRAMREAYENLSPSQKARRNTITCMTRGRNGMWVGTHNGLCFWDESRKLWRVFDRKTGGPGPEIWSVAEHDRDVWASSSAGLFRSRNGGIHWEQLPGTFPPRIGSITLRPGKETTTCWLAGFDAPERVGGGADILCSATGGRTWKTQKTGTASSIARPLRARAHSVVVIGRRLWACTRRGLASSLDGGLHWAVVQPGSGLFAEEVFDIALLGNRIWAASNEGLFYSDDDGEDWQYEGGIRCPVRALVSDGTYLWLSTSGGLLRRTRGGDWRTFSVRSNVLSLAVTRAYGGETWWVGTTAGLSFSRDSGKTWRSLTVADGLPSNYVATLVGQGNRIWAGTDGGIWTGLEGAQGGQRHGRDEGLLGLTVNDLAVCGDSVWAATNRGLSVLDPKTREWRTLLSSRRWLRVCVTQEMIYGAVTDPLDAAKKIQFIAAARKKKDWRPRTLPGRNGAVIHQILSPVQGKEIWVAADSGLYRSRDKGRTWARFSSESLWASRATRLAFGAHNMLCAHTVPTDPPSPVAMLNFTRDGGRSWKVLPAPVPGHARAILIAGDRLLAGTRDGLSVYAAFDSDFRPGRSGWLGWNRIAALAASTFRRDRLGWVSAVDSYAFHAPTLWFGSMDSGVVERGVPIMDELNRTWDITGEKPLPIGRFAMLDGERVLAVVDSPRSLWFATAKGVFFYDRAGSWTYLNPDPERQDGIAVRAVARRGRVIWAGTDDGLRVLDPTAVKWRPIRTANSLLPNDHVTALACDGERIWGGTERGAFVVDRAGKWKIVLPEEKISAITLGAAFVYFATNRGVFVLGKNGVTRRHLRAHTSALPDNDVFQVFAEGREIWARTRHSIRKILYNRAEPEVPYAHAPSRRGPDGVLVVVNDNSPDSQRVAQEYARLRKIPAENICHIVCPASEAVTRKTYERYIRDAVWHHLQNGELSRKISFIVTTFGVPLRIKPSVGEGGSPDARRTGASVDSELALLGHRHPLGGPLLNPYLHRDETFDSTKLGIYLVTRLDGPTPEAALSLVWRALGVENARSFGVQGFAKFDLCPGDDPALEQQNAAILSNFDLLLRQFRLRGRVTLPERTQAAYSAKGACHDTFFYLGLDGGEYRREVFSWMPGAVAVSLNPATATSVRDTSHAWVAAAVEAGVTATLGGVADPGEHPSLSVGNLYHFLQSGYTWAETAYMSIPQLSWQAVVIGDPLYTPFK